MSTPEAGGPGGEDASTEAGAKSKDGEESRLARLRRRLSAEGSESSRAETPRGRSRRRPTRRAATARGPGALPPKPLFSLDPPEEEKKPKRSSELRLQGEDPVAGDRLLAAREGPDRVAPPEARRAATAGSARTAGEWWSRRSRGTKIRVGAVAGILVLYLIIKFLPVPGVPCQISAAKECAPSNDTIAYVPRDAVLYAHLTVNSDSHQWELARTWATSCRTSPHCCRATRRRWPARRAGR